MSNKSEVLYLRNKFLANEISEDFLRSLLDIGKISIFDYLDIIGSKQKITDGQKT